MLPLDALFDTAAGKGVMLVLTGVLTSCSIPRSLDKRRSPPPPSAHCRRGSSLQTGSLRALFFAHVSGGQNVTGLVAAELAWGLVKDIEVPLQLSAVCLVFR